MFLVDTNVWLELLLEQDRAEDVRRSLASRDAAQLAITEFSLYSLGIILCRLQKDEVFRDFLSDVLEDAPVSRVCLGTEDLKQLLRARGQFGLDFDDAYQYVAAAKFGYALVSLDGDFDHTDRGRKTPADALSGA